MLSVAELKASPITAFTGNDRREMQITEVSRNAPPEGRAELSGALSSYDETACRRLP